MFGHTAKQHDARVRTPPGGCRPGIHNNVHTHRATEPSPSLSTARDRRQPAQHDATNRRFTARISAILGLAQGDAGAAAGGL